MACGCQEAEHDFLYKAICTQRSSIFPIEYEKRKNKIYLLLYSNDNTFVVSCISVNFIFNFLN
jgi:hypothetical protein